LSKVSEFMHFSDRCTKYHQKLVEIWWSSDRQLFCWVFFGPNAELGIQTAGK